MSYFALTIQSFHELLKREKVDFVPIKVKLQLSFKIIEYSKAARHLTFKFLQLLKFPSLASIHNFILENKNFACPNTDVVVWRCVSTFNVLFLSAKLNILINLLIYVNCCCVSGFLLLQHFFLFS